MTEPLIGGSAPSNPGPQACERGQSAPEYAVLMVLVVLIVIILAVVLFGCQPSL